MEERAHYTQLILDALPASAIGFELGCGGGIPTTQQLAEKFVVTGVDLSTRQIALARQQVPDATFAHADMTTLAFPPATFDAVVAFYAIIHVPRQEHAGLLANVTSWLQPGGLFVAAMGTGTTDAVEEEWLGAPMCFGHYNVSLDRRPQIVNSILRFT